MPIESPLRHLRRKSICALVLNFAKTDQKDPNFRKLVSILADGSLFWGLVPTLGWVPIIGSRDTDKSETDQATWVGA